MRHDGLIARVDGQAAAVVGGETGVLEPEAVGGADSSRRDQHHVADEPLAALQHDHRVIALSLDVIDLLAEPERDAERAGFVSERLDDLAVHHLQQLIALVEQGQFDP